MSNKSPPVTKMRRDRLIRERVHDPYKTRLKLTEPTVCPQCRAVFRKGRWLWEVPPLGANEELCQACHRTNDRYPAGEVSIGGDFFRAHKAEIINLARNLEVLEKGEHPLNRIMEIEEHPDRCIVRTTDIHLPRRIGAALSQAYDGELNFHYEEGSYFIRVAWER